MSWKIQQESTLCVCLRAGIFVFSCFCNEVCNTIREIPVVEQCVCVCVVTGSWKAQETRQDQTLSSEFITDASLSFSSFNVNVPLSRSSVPASSKSQEFLLNRQERQENGVSIKIGHEIQKSDQTMAKLAKDG